MATFKNNSSKFDEINKILEKYDGENPGVAVAAIKDGEVVYMKTVGLANLEYKISITEDSVFNLCSVSKSITAMGIMLLKERGMLNYDDEIIRYFPELAYYCKGITLRHLLNHTSGIINYYEILDRLSMKEFYVTNKDCYDLLKKERELLFEPGERFDYSNSNYVLLAMLVEKISKQSFDEFLKENIFKPLEMESSLVFDESQHIVKNRAYGYTINEDKFCCNYVGALTTGDGCIFSSIKDLVNFEQALYTEKIISKESLNEAFTSGKLNDGTEAGYGFGWETHRSTPTLKRLHHSGSDNGFRSLFTTFPEHRLTVILLSNFDNFSWEERLKIIDAFAEIFQIR